MTAGLAAGMLGAGEFAVSPEDAGEFIATSFARWKASGTEIRAYADQFVSELRAAKRRVPGFGHPVFKEKDPCAERLKALAIEQGVWGEANEWYEAVHHSFRVLANKPDLVINDVGMLASIMVQLGLTPAEMTGIALLSTFPRLIAHISEELRSGTANRLVPDRHATYSGECNNLAVDMKEVRWR